MAIKCCALREFTRYTPSGALKWKWPRMAKSHTYTLIFSRNQLRERTLWEKVKHQVNVLLEEDDIYNAVHPGYSKNKLVVFELPEKVGPPKPRKVVCSKLQNPDVTSSQVQSVPELSI